LENLLNSSVLRELVLISFEYLIELMSNVKKKEKKNVFKDFILNRSFN